MFKKIQPWLSAFRLRTLPLSVSGIILGSCFGYSIGAFDGWIMFLAILLTISLQVLSNLANDYGDGVRGTDNENRLGPTRAIQSGAITPDEMISGIKKNVLLIVVLTLLLIFTAFKDEYLGYALLFFVLSAAAVYAAINYTVGRSPYGYRGLGDIFVFLFFGVMSTVGSYFLYSKQLDFYVLLPAVSVGLFSVGVLNLNNMRDIESDALSNKRTLAVILGSKNAKIYHLALIILAMMVALMFSVIHFSSLWNLLFLLAYIPMSIHIVKIYKARSAPDYDSQLKVLALSTFLFSVLLGVGYIL
ncbi:1,4-dihydroxy-2-naphthoate octaprenyltransferase [Subsaximicrobium wynnwilliamsii]|uniref:1,4-dihydroxy-2-naphthoate octaprenyltransferase n=1 Tax=Subsaximicrobium wynnwilliamsii TaxID=291179 RepID=A0A5C6ZBC3_9FLAO|nr:1,4-dihydroxy-2-naphthoate octaprenyltransferase [Subsaximicrobium wynnwilliamsii]TXD81326.1 1,4-dihydroxy-2-naphthoate octaprenyltransferase [Subsaximicrobium wynnwilliamsii]TXD87305.1 1,4-dihydroxy-2-naphthoate octaprenyltransferase [Subsaximicrobium wynnwilliamsii]TXE00910.1 1,4-dihydroxy-2-naphthoate octaprenyltransferase [Subsaximicrobium wynnwilliamsii]